MLWLVLQVLFYILVSLNHLNASEITNPAFDSSDNLENVFIHNVQPLKDAETINWDILKAAVRQKLREIFAIQFPNGKYGTRYYDIENWPEGINLQRSNLWRKEELVRINAGIPFYKFVRRAEPTYPAFNSSENQEILFVHNVQPLKDAVTLNLPLLLSGVRHKLREIFTIQFPGSKYDTGAYDIENWPPGIELHGTIFWRKDELVRINAGIPFYKFVKREEALKVDSYCKKVNEKLKNMECLKTATIKENHVQNQLSRSKSMKLILDRFKVESGKTDATIIDWRLLDRRQIPLKYKDVPLKTTTLTCKLIYQNAEIVDNIHFFKYSNLNFNNQSSDNESTPSDDEVDVSEGAENFDEQKDICRCDDKNSDVINSASNDELKIDIQMPNFKENSSDELEMDEQLPSLAETQKDIDFDIKLNDLSKADDYHFEEINNENHEIEIVESFNSNSETFSTDDGVEHTPSEVKSLPDKDNFDHHGDSMPEIDKRIINHSPKLQKSLNDHDMEISDSGFDTMTQKLIDNAANFDDDAEGVSENENQATSNVQSNMHPKPTNLTLPSGIHEQQGNVNSRLIDMSNSGRHDEVFQNRDYEIRDRQEIPFTHNVQPLKNVETITANILKAAVRQKLKEIFAIQFPHRIYDQRVYDIENWPPGIEAHESKNWHKNELFRINAGIPFYKFVPRKEAFKNESFKKRLFVRLRLRNMDMECLNDEVSNETDFEQKMLNLMLKRFKVESGKTDASSIDWQLLDRRQIPQKYNDVLLNASSFSTPPVYKNPEIVDNIHFYNYLKFNGTDKCAGNESTSNVEEEDINQNLELFNENHSPKLQKSLSDHDMEITDSGFDEIPQKLNEDAANSEVDTECVSENGNQFKPDVHSEHQGRDFDISESAKNQEIEISFIHNVQPFENAEKINATVLLPGVRQKLREIFAIQLPGEKYNARNYDIENWPQDIELHGTKLWRKDELVRINERIPFYKFVPRKEVFKGDSYCKNLNDKLKNMELMKNAAINVNNVHYQMSENQIIKLMLDRFKVESGKTDATIIDWRLLDRRQIPMKYKDVQLNASHFMIPLVYRNAEIVDNIHFFKYANLNDNNQTSGSERSLKDKGVDAAEEESEHFDEQKDVCHCDDKRSDVIKPASIQLPNSEEKQNDFDIDININTRVIGKLYETAYLNENVEILNDKCDELEMDSQLPSLAETQKDIGNHELCKTDEYKFKEINNETHEKQIVDGINLNDNIEILAKSDRIEHTSSEGRLAEFDFLETSPDLDISDYSDESTAGSDMRIINHSFNSRETSPDLDISDYSDDSMTGSEMRLINHSPKLQTYSNDHLTSEGHVVEFDFRETALDYSDDSMTGIDMRNIYQTHNHQSSSNDHDMGISDSDFDTGGSADIHIATKCVSENSNHAKPNVQSNLNPKPTNLTLTNGIHEQQGNVNSRLIDISNSGRHNEVFKSRDYTIGNRQKIPFVHNVQSLKDAETINVNILKAAVRQKLREIFAIQFPGGKYDTRNYDIENWPEGIESHGAVNWRKNELVRINERIPFYKFVPRKEAAKVDSAVKIIRDKLNNMECLKKATIKNNQMSRIQIMQLMLDKFRLESGRTYAASIDWGLLDRRQIPLKYKDVPLNTTHFRISLIYRNAEIVDNIHFFKYANLNDINQTSEKEISPKDDEVVAECADPLNEQIDICLSEEEDDDDGSINIGEFEIDDQLSLFDESPNEIGFDINRRDLEKIFDFGSFDDFHSKESDSLVPNLEFNINPDLKWKRKMFELRKIVKADLNKLFKTQYPDEEFKMSHYEIRNWPEGVGLIWDRWKKAEIEKIYEKMPEFVFVKRTHKLPVKPSKGIRQSGSLIGILDSSMTYEGTCETLLNRFRQESGRSNAVKFDWKLLDRRDIPAKYDGFVFSKFNLSLKSLYKNPEIVNNIHFFNPNELEKVSHKRKSEELKIDLPQSESSAQKKNRFRYDDYDDEDEEDD